MAKEKEDVYTDLDRSRDKYEKLQSAIIRMEEEKDKIEAEANRHLAQVFIQIIRSFYILGSGMV